MRLLITFLRMYPWHSFVMLSALLLAGIAEGTSISAMLPLISIALEQNSGVDGAATTPQGDSTFSQAVMTTLGNLGITPTIGNLLCIIVAGIVLKNLLLLFAKKRIGYTAARVTTDLRLSLLRAMLSTRWDYFLHQPIGRLANAMATEAVRASSAYVWGNTLISLAIQATVYTTMALLVSWRATLACLAAGVIIVVVSHALVRMSRRAGKRQTRVLISLLARLTDTLQSVKPLKAMGREKLADAVLQAETGKLNKALQRQILSKAALESTQEPMFAIVIALGVFAALEYWNMALATVLVLVVLLARVLKQIGNVQKHYQKMAIAESAFWSLRDTIKQAQDAREVAGGNVTPCLQHDIRLDDVHFAYDKHAILRGVNLTIPAKQLTVLVGPSGAGKTTIIDLIIGFHRPTSGNITIDGTPINDINLRRWRQQIGYVPQENILLHDSIFNNVTLGDPQYSDADVEATLRSAGAWDFVATLPLALKTVVGERGTKLSGGQRQRIMIARALLHRPKLLILDEATSALDPQSEQAICDTLKQLCSDITILAISHQSALTNAADCIYRLNNGVTTAKQPPAEGFPPRTALATENDKDVFTASL